MIQEKDLEFFVDAVRFFYSLLDQQNKSELGKLLTCRFIIEILIYESMIVKQLSSEKCCSFTHLFDTSSIVHFRLAQYYRRYFQENS